MTISDRTQKYSPFVNTPLGIGVVEGSDNAFYFVRKYYVRFEGGWARWISVEDCEQVDAPAGYQPPSLCDLPGVLG